MTSSPFRITVYDKAFGKRGTIGAPASVKWQHRHNGLSTATVVVDADHPRVPDLLTRGCRMHVDYGQHRIGGLIRRKRVVGPSSRAVVEVEVHDDWRLLTRMLGWAVPGAGVGGQTVAYDVRTGPVETVVKGYIAANATRLGLPVTVAPDQGRGASVDGALRFHPLADRVVPLLDAGGVGFTVRQQGAGFVVDAYAVEQHPRTLTERSGVVRGWEWIEDAPNATRTVAGAQGEAEARDFYGPLIDGALEAEWGDVVEVFTDARNAGTNDTDPAAAALDAMTKKLAEGRAQAGLKVQLSETDTFRYGTAVTRGDRVSLEVGPGIVLDDVLREAELEWSGRGPLTVTPIVGDRNDVDHIIPRALAALGRGMRDLAGR